MQGFQVYLNITELIVAVVLILVILVQVKGAGTGLFGSAEGSFSTRRAVEQTLFQFIIALGLDFLQLSMLSVYP